MPVVPCSDSALFQSSVWFRPVPAGIRLRNKGTFLPTCWCLFSKRGFHASLRQRQQRGFGCGKPDWAPACRVASTPPRVSPASGVRGSPGCLLPAAGGKTREGRRSTAHAEASTPVTAAHVALADARQWVRKDTLRGGGGVNMSSTVTKYSQSDLLVTSVPSPSTEEMPSPPRAPEVSQAASGSKPRTSRPHVFRTPSPPRRLENHEPKRQARLGSTWPVAVSQTLAEDVRLLDQRQRT